MFDKQINYKVYRVTVIHYCLDRMLLNLVSFRIEFSSILCSQFKGQNMFVYYSIYQTKHMVFRCTVYVNFFLSVNYYLSSLKWGLLTG